MKKIFINHLWGKVLILGFFIGTNLLFFDKALATESRSFDIIVRGTVRDVNSQPLPGVIVVVQGSNVGTVTDGDGSYRLNAPENATLSFSFIGFISQSVAIGNRSVIDIVLEEDLKSLDEVVVVGYGTQKRANLTGSVATIDADEIIKRPGANVANLLQGKVAGLTGVLPFRKTRQ
jgi:hypothetical protein